VRAQHRGPRVQLHPGSIRLLRLGLLAVAVLASLRSAVLLVLYHPLAVDLEIPLRATERWLRGEPPYLASAFELPAGPDLPFLYPPPLLPLLSPLTELPRWLVAGAWLLFCLGCAAYALRRLDVPARWWLLFLLSPPFLEPLIGGNVQLVMLALFAWLFFAPSEREPTFTPRSRDPAAPSLGPAKPGLAASLIAGLKVSQAHAWAYLLAHRPGAALLGGSLVLAATIATLPMTGVDLWFEWVAQVRRAADPTWVAAGISIGAYLPPGIPPLVSLVALIAVVRVPRARAGEWVGLLTVVGAPSLHTFNVLPMLPAFLRVRREVALLAAIFVATLTEPGVWLAIGLTGLAYALGERFPALREPAAA
jgi:hypothetical protein